jgi:hypothetical protein
MDIVQFTKSSLNQIFIAKETPFGYKLVKTDKLIDLDNFNIVPAGVDEYYLEKKAEYKKIDKTDLGKYNFSNSKIKEVTINNGSSTIKSLSKILSQIYKQIGSSNKIIKNTKLNIIKVENKVKGREFIRNLGISYPKPDSNLCVFEIVNQCEMNEIKIDLKFELVNKELIKVKN